MDWKSTVVISGAGILATWFVSMPVAHPPGADTRPPVASQPRAAASAIDIQQEAARLEVRVPRDPNYVETSRDPFRFGAGTAPAARPSGTSGSAAPVVPLLPAPPAPLRITLNGIASDVVDGHDQRTAILHTDAGVVLVREGEQVAGQFTVGKIGADAVELIKVSDGSTLRLALP